VNTRILPYFCKLLPIILYHSFTHHCGLPTADCQLPSIMHIKSLSILLFLSSTAFAQSEKKDELPIFKNPKPIAEAFQTNTPPKLDGKLDDAVWQKAQVLSNFTQESPKLGDPARRKTEARIVYDDEAIYVSMRMWEVSRDSVLRELTVRDGESNSDWSMICFDTYEDGQNGFSFSVTPTNIQSDFKILSGDLDKTWNAVWFSETQLLDDGWSAEYKIPYSAIRFSDKPEQRWNIQIGREARSIRETSWWSPYNPNTNGFMNQGGKLTGIKGIKPPLRLALLPYVSGILDIDGKGKATPDFRAGMDLKYGINEAFTLDMTLVPDFGQVRSDNQVLNLSPFEVRYDEQRPFFTEGIELFSKGELLYSRRIGDTPSGYYSVEDQLKANEKLVFNPQKANLINSTKVSGRTKQGLGIGVLNSITGETFAEAKNEKDGSTRKILTEPLINYNVMVFDQNLKNNSSISFINTNVLRNGGDADDANVSAIRFNINDKSNKYGIRAATKWSQLFGKDGQIVVGKQNFISLARISGKLTYSLNYSEMDDKYEINDLGYLNYNNERAVNLNFGYSEFKPKKGPFINYSGYGNISHSRVYAPDVFQSFGINIGGNATTKKFNSMGVWTYFEPFEANDFYEPRKPYKRYFKFATSYNLGGWYSSDYRKKFAYDISLNRRSFNDFEGRERYNLNIGISPRFRVNNQLSFVLDMNSYNQINDLGWADSKNDDDIIFGRRDVRTFENLLTAKYIFTNRMGLSFRARHYWSTAKVKDYYLLNADGTLNPNYASTGFKPENFSRAERSSNFFNIDMVYSWVFQPGSEMTFVWKNAIAQFQPNNDYIQDFRTTWESPQANNMSIKILYYLDYLILKKQLSKKS
jgi:hypothetical protein